MSGPVIAARDVRKKYRLFPSPMARLKEALHPFRRRYHNEFWALKGVSFEIEQGETFGILGRNGSGKSTLLQIFAKVLQPTTGSVAVAGRVSALLELGAGFSPDFTGRENVMLNGAILRVAQKEMEKRLPEIEAFADVGEFFDQPVKTYSSGMFARVAFAAAINVDPDILIVDEALAVGDVRFQHKCYEQMRKLASRGCTVVFVTHSIDVIVSHCTRAAVLDAGQLAFIGPPRAAVDRYLQLLFGEPRKSPSEDGQSTSATSASAAQADQEGSKETGAATRTGKAPSPALMEASCTTRPSYNPNETRITGDEGGVRIVDFVLQTDESSDTAWVMENTVVTILFKTVFDRPMLHPIFGFALKNLEGIVIYATNTFMMQHDIPAASAGEERVVSFSFAFNVQPGGYFIDLGVSEVDGSPGGRAVDIRRSLAHLMVGRRGSFPKFDGAADLAATFQAVA